MRRLKRKRRKMRARGNSYQDKLLMRWLNKTKVIINELRKEWPFEILLVKRTNFKPNLGPLTCSGKQRLNDASE
ncbi:hypothetical protein AM593_00534, partial [Mytilus galloprovincialis]